MIRYDQVIVALDSENPDHAYSLVESLGDKIEWYKIGNVLHTHSGSEFISYLHKKRKKIFLDLKLHDTPKVVSNTVQQFAELGVQFATVHTLGGRRMLEAAASGCRGSQLKLLGVTLLTTLEPKELNGLGWNPEEEARLSGLVDLAVQCRLAGVLSSPQALSKIGPRTVPGFLKVVAGIRDQGLPVYGDDQVSFATAAQAFEWGADYIIVGRPIAQSPNPLQALATLLG